MRLIDVIIRLGAEVAWMIVRPTRWHVALRHNREFFYFVLLSPHWWENLDGTPIHLNFFNIEHRKNAFNIKDVEFDFSTACILVFFPSLLNLHYKLHIFLNNFLFYFCFLKMAQSSFTEIIACINFQELGAF